MEHPTPVVPDGMASVGIDLGIKTWVVCPDGYEVLKVMLDGTELKRRQRRLSRAVTKWQGMTEWESGLLNELTPISSQKGSSGVLPSITTRLQV